MARLVSQASPLSTYLTGETTPGSSVSTDAEWDTWIQGAVGTEYHPTGTCAMLPLELGGVVSPSLLVYGTSNVRVADASVYPFELSSHVRSSIYLNSSVLISPLYSLVPPLMVSQNKPLPLSGIIGMVSRQILILPPLVLHHRHRRHRPAQQTRKVTTLYLLLMDLGESFVQRSPASLIP